VDNPVIGAALGLYAISAVRPELPLGAETVRGLQNAKQHGRPDPTDPRNLTELFPGLVFLTFLQQLAPNFPTQCSQGIQLLAVKLRPAPQVLFPEGVEYSSGKFGTTTTCLFFSGIEAKDGEKEEMVGPCGLEPQTSTVSRQP